MHDEALVLAIDQGTTNAKAILVDKGGKIVAGASRPIAIGHPQPGWVEQDATAMQTTVRECIEEVIVSAGTPVLAGIGISNQRESGVAWDRDTGLPITTPSAPELWSRSPTSRPLLKHICNVGFEHHSAMSPSHTADVVAEALENYLGWEVYRHV